MFKKIFIPSMVILFIVFIGFVQINIINTKALSPIGNSEDNFNMVREEFGEDFNEFIKDSSPVKIYVEDDITVSINNQDYLITNSNPIIQGFQKVATTISYGFNYIKTSVDNFINKINTNNESKHKESEIDIIIDEYIEKNKDVNSNNTK